MGYWRQRRTLKATTPGQRVRLSTNYNGIRQPKLGAAAARREAPGLHFSLANATKFFKTQEAETGKHESGKGGEKSTRRTCMRTRSGVSHVLAVSRFFNIGVMTHFRLTGRRLEGLNDLYQHIEKGGIIYAGVTNGIVN